jgi:hypothetical protein
MRSISAQSSGILAREIAPVTIPGKRGKKEVIVSQDEECSKVKMQML